MELYLNDCYYVPSLSKNIISISVLDTEGFCFSIKNQTLTFSYDDLVYDQANSISSINILDTTTNFYHVEKKRLKKGNTELSCL